MTRDPFPMPDSYTVRLIDMPVRKGGMISEDPDGHINVYINARLSSTGQHTAAYHEWRHWLDDDLHNDKDIREVEGEGSPPRKARALPPMKRARDLIPRQYTRPTEADDWQNDVYLRMQDY